MDGARAPRVFSISHFPSKAKMPAPPSVRARADGASPLPSTGPRGSQITQRSWRPTLGRIVRTVVASQRPASGTAYPLAYVLLISRQPTAAPLC